MRFLKFLVLLAFFASASLAAIPNAQQATGSNTGAGVTCALASSGADGTVVILDGQAVATSTITVAVQVLDPLTGNYSTPTTIGGVSQPITLTNATTQVITIAGGYPGIQINVTSFGTATGTFRGVILTY